MEVYSAKSAPRMGPPGEDDTPEKTTTVAGLAGSEIPFQKRVLDEDVIPLSLSADAVQLDETAKGERTRTGGQLRTGTPSAFVLRSVGNSAHAGAAARLPPLSLEGWLAPVTISAKSPVNQGDKSHFLRGITGRSAPSPNLTLLRVWTRSDVTPPRPDGSKDRNEKEHHGQLKGGGMCLKRARKA